MFSSIIFKMKEETKKKEFCATKCPPETCSCGYYDNGNPPGDGDLPGDGNPDLP